jgi:hypothetical protein
MVSIFPFNLKAFFGLPTSPLDRLRIIADLDLGSFFDNP